MSNTYKIAIIGGGNGGQTMAGHFGLLGHEVSLYNCIWEPVAVVAQQGGVLLKEAIQGFGRIHRVTDKIEEAVAGAEIIMVTTTADAHAEIARNMAPCIEDGQTIVLNPGRTGGAIQFRHALRQFNLQKSVVVAETQSLIYACRADVPGEARVIGVKNKLPLAALPATDTEKTAALLNSIYDCFIPVEHVLVTSLENIGAIFHPPMVLFNAAAIERGQQFMLYNDMTPGIAEFIQNLDAERLMIGRAYGLNLVSATEWVSLAYPNVGGTNLCEKMRDNPAYYKIQAPTSLDSRMLTEDIPTGILPMMELARLADVETPLMDAIFTLAERLLHRDFKLQGRTLANLGLAGKDKAALLAMVCHGMEES